MVSMKVAPRPNGVSTCNEVKWTENVQQTQQAGSLAPNYRVTTEA